jgi:hypothetical protein
MKSRRRNKSSRVVSEYRASFFSLLYFTSQTEKKEGEEAPKQSKMKVPWLLLRCCCWGLSRTQSSCNEPNVLARKETTHTNNDSLLHVRVVVYALTRPAFRVIEAF